MTAPSFHSDKGASLESKVTVWYFSTWCNVWSSEHMAKIHSRKYRIMNVGSKGSGYEIEKCLSCLLIVHKLLKFWASVACLKYVMDWGSAYGVTS